MMSERLRSAIEALKRGQMVILTDSAKRENEGDLVLPAQFATSELINFMIRFGRGLICLSLEKARVEELDLPLMPSRGPNSKKTAFTVSIEARDGVTTGISAADRARTIRVASDPDMGPGDIVTPGHIFPLQARDGGVLARPGHTEGSVDLMKVAGLRPAAVICEIILENGEMARQADLERFAEMHGFPIVSIEEVIEYRVFHDPILQPIAPVKLPLQINGERSEFLLHAFRSTLDDSEVLALVKGNELTNPLVRVHSECWTGDVLGSLRCDCGAQLHASLEQIHKAESGILIYLRGQEGRGIGLINKLKAYSLQEQGFDTVEANHQLGFEADLRRYTPAAHALRLLGIKSVRLMTNNPNKVQGLEEYNIVVTERIPLAPPGHEDSLPYLRTKAQKLGHLFSPKESSL